MLPYVKINFAKGLIGSLEPMADGVCGLIAEAANITQSINSQTVTTFRTGKSYPVSSLEDLVDLGFADDDETTPNGKIYAAVRDFYRSAPAGSLLFVFGKTTGEHSLDVKNMQSQSDGAIRILIDRVRAPSGDIQAHVNTLQSAAEGVTDGLFAPLVVITGSKHTDHGTSVALSANRVAVVAGDGNLDCHLAGRMAGIPVHRSIARVKDGAIFPTSVTVNGAEITDTMSGQLHDKGYIVPRKFTGKGGYYWSDDKLASGISDDYALIPRRRTADKAFRVAYAAMLNELNDEIAVTSEGEITAPVCKALENKLRSAVVNQMTSVGNLATDASDPNDMGVTVFIDPGQNILATSRLQVKLRIRPYGYAKYIEVDLGFQTSNE